MLLYAAASFMSICFVMFFVPYIGNQYERDGSDSTDLLQDIHQANNHSDRYSNDSRISDRSGDDRNSDRNNNRMEEESSSGVLESDENSRIRKQEVLVEGVEEIVGEGVHPPKEEHDGSNKIFTCSSPVGGEERLLNVSLLPHTSDVIDSNIIPNRNDRHSNGNHDNHDSNGRNSESNGRNGNSESNSLSYIENTSSISLLDGSIGKEDLDTGASNFSHLAIILKSPKLILLFLGINNTPCLSPLLPPILDYVYYLCNCFYNTSLFKF